MPQNAKNACLEITNHRKIQDNWGWIIFQINSMNMEYSSMNVECSSMNAECIIIIINIQRLPFSLKFYSEKPEVLNESEVIKCMKLLQYLQH